MACCFSAMASPCEILFVSTDEGLVQQLGVCAAAEVRRIEQRYSRYQSDSILSQMNARAGASIEVDDETARLLDYAALAHNLSDGLFDISSGLLRRVWRFDGSDRIADQAQIDALLPHIGWHRLHWHKPFLSMPAGMELDLGGIAKEYAADRVLHLLQAQTDVPLLVNLGGDLCCRGTPVNGFWQVGVERPSQLNSPQLILDLASGGLATSGDTRRYLQVGSQRYSHILNPKTGWPVRGGPRSVTVAAPFCVQAGMLATMALLQGDAAELFLQDAGVQYWCLYDPLDGPESTSV